MARMHWKDHEMRRFQFGRCGSRLPDGFTLVELLVVITIIGALVMLLLQAIQSARESARKVQCENNIRQVGLALLSYHGDAKTFPPSSIWPDPRILSETATTPRTTLGPSWAILVLPYLESQPVFDAFDPTLSTTHAANRLARSTEIANLLCPTDVNNRVMHSGLASHGDDWARGNYAANGATTHLGGSVLTPSGRAGEGWLDANRQGVMGANHSLSIQDIGDGASNTFLIGEIRAGVVRQDARGVWALSGAGPSSLWAHAVCGDAAGPNASTTTHADDTAGCSFAQYEFGGDGELAKQGMSCWGGDWQNLQATMRSSHAGGVFAGMADGSVTWVSDDVELADRPCGRKAVIAAWDRMVLSNDGLPVR